MFNKDEMPPLASDDLELEAQIERVFPKTSNAESSKTSKASQGSEQKQSRPEPDVLKSRKQMKQGCEFGLDMVNTLFPVIGVRELQPDEISILADDMVNVWEKYPSLTAGKLSPKNEAWIALGFTAGMIGFGRLFEKMKEKNEINVTPDAQPQAAQQGFDVNGFTDG